MRTMRLGAMVVAMLGAMLLSGCSSRPPEPMDQAAMCRARLASLNVVFEPMTSIGNEDKGCGVQNPVKISTADIALNQPAVVDCGFAETLAAFDQQVVQPAAQRWFGKPVAKLRHMGTYSCRNKTGGLHKGLSEHAFGRAIDIGGFQLSDGTLIDVRHDWSGNDAKAGFLRDVARQACRRFSVVLTPNHDVYHRDHLHLDIGRYAACGI
jgi:hypothetical protein